MASGSSSTVMAHDCSNGNTGTSNTNGNTGTSTTNGNTAMGYDCSNGNTSITIMANSGDSATSSNIGIINSPTEVMYVFVIVRVTSAASSVFLSL